jgi:hypothetical protein
LAPPQLLKKVDQNIENLAPPFSKVEKIKLNTFYIIIMKVQILIVNDLKSKQGIIKNESFDL